MLLAPARYAMPMPSRKLNGSFHSKIRPHVLARDGHRCQIRNLHVCENLDGLPMPASKLEVDHIVGRNAGGSDSLSNLRASCRACNRSRAPGQRSDGFYSRKW